MAEITLIEQFLEIDGSRLPLYSISISMPTLAVDKATISAKISAPAGMIATDFSNKLTSIMKYPKLLPCIGYYYRNKSTEEEIQIQFINSQLTSWTTYAGVDNLIDMTFTATSLKTIDFTKSLDLVD